MSTTDHSTPLSSATRARLDRRTLLKIGAGTLGAAVPGLVLGRYAPAASAVPAAAGLMDPASQPLFTTYAPNALDPGFLFKDLNEEGHPAFKPNFSIRVAETTQQTGLVDPRSGRRLRTRVWGYGNKTVSWPGQTFQVVSSGALGADETVVRWANELQGKKHLLPVDTNLHWCFSLHGSSSANGVDYRQYSIAKDGVPIITHLHGGHSMFQYDGNPEFFYTPDGRVTGPQWDFVDGGFTSTFHYDNNVPAGNLWYHDHALGLTRLNVYAGLAGFYFVRDDQDTGMAGNPLGLPAFPYELAYAIQDRMFTDRGDLFYPAYPGDPFYEGFITDEEAELPEDLFPGGGPTALAEFFGDFIVVNGKIWPKEDVEPRHYRMRLLNGCDSRFMVLQLVVVNAGGTDPSDGTPIPFDVIGSDQGLGESRTVDTLVFEPGGRYDIVVDFGAPGVEGKRVIMRNLGGDAPFGGDYGDALPDPEEDEGTFFPNRRTDRVMAFDVVRDLDGPDTYGPFDSGYAPVPVSQAETVRRVALFEGTDEFGRLQPLLGTVSGDPESGTGEATAHTWSEAATETPTVDTTEVWEVYNFTGDAHPVHLHLVNFTILERRAFTFDEAEEPQTIVQHNGATGQAPKPVHIQIGDTVEAGSAYYETAPKDMVTALPGDPDDGQGQMVRIRTHFDRLGRYVWHCHILSHEDHEMMRVLKVVPVPEA
jgi:spore coat protein A